ncbi:Chaperone protein DnaJ [Phlyctema vagabunda]|uniref:Chaperone protein DnaJ n=1 Tax=Phlyctema vagabunda TaxID=108571 RepID=A0ABR4PM88_9HELO
MPPRSLFSPLAPAPRLPVYKSRRLFYSSPIFRVAAGLPNHYDTLKIPTNATPSEVKKSFYSLSKTHHPDRNPDDPNASERFVKISEAYTILGTPAKRQQYDRDFLRSSPSHAAGHGASHARPTGSYSSSGPVGGRPASGLSKRRTQFRGPPPSFYRSGGWGEHSAKRQAAQGGTSHAPPSGEATQNSGTAGGMGPGQSPWRGENDVPHFDREGHFRTQDNIYSQQRRRRQSRMEQYDPIVPDRGTLGKFLLLTSIVFFAVFVPGFVFDRVPKKKNVD